MHRWARAITVGVGGVALTAAAIGAGISPAGAEEDEGDPTADSSADAVVWNDQFATVEVVNDGTSSTGGNETSSNNGNLVVIGQGARADAFSLSVARPEIMAWFTSEGFANWLGVGGSIDAGFQIVPGSPVVVPVLGGTAENLIGTINNTATGLATIFSGSAAVGNSTGVSLGQAFSGNGGAMATSGAAANSDATSAATAEVGNTQTAAVGVSNNGHASTGGNSASTNSGNAVLIGQGASAGAAGVTVGNAGDSTSDGSVTGGTASNTVNSVSNTAQGASSIQTGNAAVANSTNVSVSQSNTGNGGATATSSATAGGG
jgi:hypothetical protein